MRGRATANLRWLLGAGGLSLLLSPVREHRALWSVRVGNEPPFLRPVHSGPYITSIKATIHGLKTRDRRHDAELRVLLGAGVLAMAALLSVQFRAAQE